MASNPKYSTVLQQLRHAGIPSSLGASALLKIYDGTQPASPDTAISTQTLLSTHTCSATFAPAASSAHPSVLTANAIGSATAGNPGTASWYRMTTSGGTAHVDGSAGTSSADLILNSVSITAGQTVSVSSLAVTSFN